jgi:hypothetical protein
MANKDWRDTVLEDLNKEGYVAIESLDILTGKDVRAAMDAVKQSELHLNEAEEWKHIRELQRKKADRLFGGSSI